jgi:hypothetical protein
LLEHREAAVVWRAAEVLAERRDIRCLAAGARLLDDPGFMIRQRAIHLLRRLTKQNFPYDPAGPEAERRADAVKWREWVASPAAAIRGQYERELALVLFNGSNLRGWTVWEDGRPAAASVAWEAMFGMLHCNGRTAGDLRSNELFDDYQLELEYRLHKLEEDSGVALWFVGDRREDGGESLEVKLDPSVAGELECVRRGVSDTVARKAEVATPLGEWHRLRVTVGQGTVAVGIDGTAVNHTAVGAGRPSCIGLRNPGGPVDFRSISLRLP